MHHASLNICSVGGGVLNKGWGAVLQGAAVSSSSWGYAFATDHTACYHDNKQKFPFNHFTQVLFNTDPALPSPPSTPPPHPSSYYPPVSSERHLEFGECSSIDRLQMSGARLVT